MTIAGDSLLGRSACNNHGGDIKIEGSRVEFGGGSMTDRGCIDSVLKSEGAYIEALRQVRSISLTRDGGNLELTGEAVELTYERLPPLRTKELVGHTWHLESMVEGRGPDATATSAKPAELMMARDGTFTGSTGCRRLTGEWSEYGDSILFHTMTAHGRCPKGLRDQDAYVGGVLGDGFTATIHSGRLTISNVRGYSRLIYRAE